MRVQLLKDVAGQGKRGDMKTVSDGYGRNFLIPRALAKALTAAEEREATQKKKEEETHAEESRGKYREEAAALKGRKFQIRVKTGAKGEVWSPVREAEIKDALAKEGVRDIRMKLERPLKALGEHAIEIEFGLGITTVVVIELLPL